ncbi:uncharacterized protein L969DRAFT_96134 [Mixia osmundae IAM 14324]|uniref:uncharacterized protein n=1 Tax=Mixia osmundae (strain CBS 9802 / IAM 14324 / JCM 22182 / KY 12970) TaxID=764103 RepID=UPI0004A55844|nr:uncharacterized protein L969DRAFT_96134 [Mixia osmundae IAM 14324]KEI37607.1 hypothetical protein L969DRAFT_96134 [Mixia osmundae IAM 14324]
MVIQAGRHWSDHFNFFRIHLVVFITLPLILSGIFYAINVEPNIAFIDCLYMCYAAMTMTGLQSVLFANMTRAQQGILFIQLVLGSIVTVSIVTIVVRLRAYPAQSANTARSSRSGSTSLELARRKQDGKHVRLHTGLIRRTADEVRVNALSNAGNEATPMESRSLQCHERIPSGPTQLTFDETTRSPVLRHRRSDSTTHRPSIYRGLGGFENPAHSLYRVLTGQVSNAHAIGRTTTQISTHSHRHHLALAGTKPISYLSFDATIGRNSRYLDLAPEELAELVELEQRALRLLLIITTSYYFGLQLLFVAVLAPYFAVGNYSENFTQAEGTSSSIWFVIFNTWSAFGNNGLSLLDANFTAFQSCYLLILSTSFLILAGNTCFPVFLRGIIWSLSKFVPSEHTRGALHFLLDHPRRCYLYLFPAKQTIWLATIVFVFTAIDWLSFLVLDIGNDLIDTIPLNVRVIDGLFQSTAVRTAGFSIVPLATTAPAVQVLFATMMYISAFPLTLSIRTTNVYDEQGRASEGSEEDRLAHHARKQLAFDIWWVVLAIWLICIIERHGINDPSQTSVGIFAIVFEVISAYGTVGLSLGAPGGTSLSGTFRTLSKLIIIAVMIRGRHRGLPNALDRSILLPATIEALRLDQDQDEMNGECDGSNDSRLLDDSRSASLTRPTPLRPKRSTRLHLTGHLIMRTPSLLLLVRRTSSTCSIDCAHAKAHLESDSATLRTDHCREDCLAGGTSALKSRHRSRKSPHVPPVCDYFNCKHFTSLASEVVSLSTKRARAETDSSTMQQRPRAWASAGTPSSPLTATATAMLAQRQVQVDMRDFPPERIRSFTVIAHIDHGKSTLSDRLLELTKTIPAIAGFSNSQVLDKLKVERERGITVKAQSATMIHRHTDGHRYLLQLIDSPGHVDFASEVHRGLSASQGALLLVDATQGIQAQTLSVLEAAQQRGISILGVLNKVDLGHAEPAKVEAEMRTLLGQSDEEIYHVSAKTGLGVKNLLSACVDHLPPPPRLEDNITPKALVFDSWYDGFRGVVSLLAVKSGSFAVGDKIASYYTKKTYTVTDLGIMHPDQVSLKPGQRLSTGQIGWLTCAMKDPLDAQLGDTFYLAGQPVEPFEQHSPLRSMIFGGIYSQDSRDFTRLEESVRRLALTDRSVQVSRESSLALGQGLRLGFLGALHMDVFRQRLEDEYDADVIVTKPFTTVKVIYKKGTEEMIDSPNDFPEVKLMSSGGIIDHIEEPIIRATIVTPDEFVGPVMVLCTNHRAQQDSMTYLDASASATGEGLSGRRVVMTYTMPLSSIVTTFYSSLKSITSGYASFDYDDAGWQASDLVKLTVLINATPVDALAFVVHRSEVEREGRDIATRLRTVIPRQQYEVVIQTAVGSKIVARERIAPLRKDVTGHLYGGDITRRTKLLDQQKKGKKQLKARSVGNVVLPNEVFSRVLTK